MTLSAGTRLGPYEIVAPLGAGGMGEVYRARDARLGRDVAVKILPEEVASDPERMSRFEREARLLAALNHPNIAAIHGLEESGPRRALVMELVEGPTLAEVLARGRLPIEEALPIARQIAEGIEYAHEQGIVHRDLKPANVKLRPDGVAKILDFGLARAMHGEAAAPGADLSHSPTITAAATKAGVILGTAAYMSPEQARGKVVDRRADIWAFGCLLYEMLAGRRAFPGETTSDTLAAVLRGEPEWEALPTETSVPLRNLLRRCLAKDPKQRIRDIGDARLAMEDAASWSAETPLRQAPAPSKLLRLPWALAAVMTVVAAVLAVRMAVAPTPAHRPVARFRISLPEQVDQAKMNRSVAISPDGTQIAYVGGQFPDTRIYHRRLEEADFKPMTGSEGASDPFFSPDGKAIGFFAGARLKRLVVATGQVDVISDNLDPTSHGGSWGSDQSILFSLDFSRGISRLPALPSGKAPELVFAPDAASHDRGLIWPQQLPLDDLVLFTAFAGDITSMDDARLVIGQPSDPTKRWTLTSGGADGRYLPTGHLVYGRNGSLMAAPLDLRSRRIADPVVVLDGVQTFPANGAAGFSASETGNLVYVPGGAMNGRDNPVLIDRLGKESAIELPAGAGATLSSPSIAADGLRIAVVKHTANDEIDVLEFASGIMSRATVERGDERSPVWAPAGASRLAYSSEAGPVAQMFLGDADGSGKREPLFPGERARYPHAFSPDGKLLAFEEMNAATNWDIWVGKVGSGGEARPFLNTPSSESFPSFSPDGRWIAYQSDESGGRMQVFVVSYPEGSGKRQVSQEGGTEPRWAASGRELFYRNGNELVAVETALSPSLAIGRHQVLFETRPGFITSATPWGSYAVMPDGQRFVFIDQSKTAPPIMDLIVVLNWFEELKAKVPVR